MTILDQKTKQDIGPVKLGNLKEKMVDQLAIALKIALANTFQMYFRAHSYHWNVEGPNFNDYHGFFAVLYEELFAAVDPIAEHLRVVDAYAPFSLTDLKMAATVNEDLDRVGGNDYDTMFTNLLADNAQIVEALSKAHSLAISMNKHGMALFLAERMDVHAKHAWMLRSFLRKG